MHWLRGFAAAIKGPLLRILLVWKHTMPSDPDRRPRRLLRVNREHCHPATWLSLIANSIQSYRNLRPKLWVSDGGQRSRHSLRSHRLPHLTRIQRSSKLASVAAPFCVPGHATSAPIRADAMATRRPLQDFDIPMRRSAFAAIRRCRRGSARSAMMSHATLTTDASVDLR